MTKSEFAQRVAIALAGNSRFTPSYSAFESDITSMADKVADYFAEHSKNGAFDEGFSYANIVTAINDVEQELERGFDNLCDIR